MAGASSATNDRQAIEADRKTTLSDGTKGERRDRF